MKKVLLSLLALTLVFFVIGCKGNKSVAKNTEPQSAANSQVSSENNSTTQPASNTPVGTTANTQANVTANGNNSNIQSGENSPEDPSANSQATITADEAKAIALDHAGFSEGEVYDFESELDHERGTLVYEISFENKNVDYEYIIDATTGEILHSEVDRY